MGAGGAFGQIFVKKLSSAGIEVTGLDLKKPRSAGTCRSFIKGDFGEILRQGGVPGQDLLLFCTPEEVVEKNLSSALNSLDLLVCSDICSVKSRIQKVIGQLRSPKQKSVSYIGIHPMFGPVADFRGHNLCIVPMQHRRRPAARRFVELVRGWSAQVTILSAAEHDQITAWSQATAHVLLLAYAKAMSASGLSIKSAMRVATPIQKVVLSLADRVASGGEDTSWQIQRQNPLARVARKQLILNLTELATRIEKGDYRYFLSALSAAGNYLSTDTKLGSFSASIVAAARSREKNSVR